MTHNFRPSTGTQSSANFILTSKLHPLTGTQSSGQFRHDMTIPTHLPGLKKATPPNRQKKGCHDQISDEAIESIKIVK